MRAVVVSRKGTYEAVTIQADRPVGRYARSVDERLEIAIWSDYI
jgi:hypothetical protein